MPESKRILLLVDNEDISRYLREELIINGGYEVTFESSVQGSLDALRRDAYDLVICQFGVGETDGPSIIRGYKKVDNDCVIIAFLERETPELLQGIVELGVYDFISKPINLEKLFFLVKKGIELHTLILSQRKLLASFQEQNVSLQKQNGLLVKRIEESTKNLTRLYEDLRSNYMRTIRVLAQAIEARDTYTHSHSENVARYAVSIAEEMHLSAKEVENLREACELHDLGTIGIPDSILTKPAGLTNEEWVQMKRHPEIAAQILEPLTFLSGVIEVVRQHHEHFDGSGYPEGRKHEDILTGARILHVADAYDAMTSARSYRKNPLSKAEAVGEVRKFSGTQFDPKVVEAFMRVVDNF
jgi:putative two-component system response regulator